MTDDLAKAVARLAAYRARWTAGDMVDRRSRLTADDLDLILEQLRGEATEWIAIDPAIRELCH